MVDPAVLLRRRAEITGLLPSWRAVAGRAS